MDEELRPAVLKFKHDGGDRVLFFEDHHDAFDVAFDLDCKWEMFSPEMIAAGEIPEEFKPRKANRLAGM